MSVGDEPEGFQETLPARPEADKLERAVARSRVAAKLFAKPPEQIKLGRYHLLEMVGSGGMGIVWGAWDPELDRRVAIKLVKAELAPARERILFEGQALAKLSHPNVVPVYDVGVVDEQIYLVMEWVRGRNLRAYCREPRSVREIVALYRAAGEGLAAAHRAGLVHRDFKPDNAMIGDDGRVRVLDFGLARTEVRPDSDPGTSSDLTRGAGTPRYMAPEQAEGKQLTPAVDQYALAVALRESLVGRHADGNDADVPRWLGDIIGRATAVDPARRYPAMDDLLRALARDPRTVWGRRFVALGAFGLAGAAFAVGTLRGEVETCSGGDDEIAKVWNASAARAVATHLGSLGAYGAEEATRLVDDLTSYSRRWATTHARLCEANERKELGPQLYDLRLGCLARAQVALQTVHDVLVRADAQRLPGAVYAARALPDVEACTTETSTLDPPPAPQRAEVASISRELARVRYLALAADPGAREVAHELAGRADTLGYLPLVARARLALAFAILGDGTGAQKAIPELATARSAALRARDLVTFVEAYAREVYANTLTSSKTPELDVGATQALARDIAVGTGASGAFARALLFNNLGTDRMAASDFAAARALFERARGEAAGVHDVELVIIAGNLAMVSDDPARRASLFDEEYAKLSRALGAQHPFTITSRMRSAQYIDDPREAARRFRDACKRFATWHAGAKRTIETCNFELGMLAAERGDDDEMREAFAAVSSKPGYVAVAKATLQIADGAYDDASRAMHALAGELAEKPSWPARLLATDALLVAARADRARGRHAAARGALERALAILDGPGFNSGASYYERRLNRARAMLAKLLATAEPSAAERLADEALRWYRQANGYDAIVAELAAITDSR